MLRKTVTVLFADVTGSTDLGERLDPEALRRVMSRYFEVAREILERHGGTVEKFIGDAVMAVFGIPVVHEDDALRALRAAAELQDAELDVQLRIGVNTGEVVTGESDTLVTGDAVNVAARLEQAAGAGEILIGAATNQLARNAVRVEPVEPVEAKGKSEPVPAWRLVEVLDDVPAFTRRLDVPFVGRSDELAQLVAVFERAKSESSVQLATLLGPGGIGKSRLARELVERVGDGARVVVGRCLPYGEGITYWPLAEIVRQIAGDRSGLRALVEDDLVADRVAAAVGLGGASGPTEETHWAGRKVFETLARERPLVVVLDDLHWAEPTFLDLVEYVAGFSTDAPILLLCTARAELLESRPSWTAPRPNAIVLSLAPLAEEDAAELVGDVEAEDRRRILEAAEGNPLFVEQLLAMRAEGDGELTVPPTIQALLAARIDALARGERVVIERGSVEGRLFHRGAVAELAPEEVRSEVSALLLALVRKEFVRPDRSELPGDDGFRFAHILVRDAAYEAMPKELRADLHERFAHWLEEKAHARPGELEEIVAYHLEQAVLYRREVGLVSETALAARAGALLGGTGLRALDRGDLAAGRNLLERAVAVLPGGEERARLLPALGSVLIEFGEFDAARRVLEDAVAESERVGQRTSELEARLLVAMVEQQTDVNFDVDAVDVQLASMLAELEQVDAQRALLTALGVQYRLALMRGVYVDLAASARRMYALARELGDARKAGEAAFIVPAALWLGPEPVSTALIECERLLAEADGPIQELGAMNSLAGLRSMQGKTDEARRQIRQVRAGYRDLGLLLWAAATGLGEGYVELDAGETAAAVRVVRESCAELRAMGETAFLSTQLCILAEALYRLDDLDAAEAATHEAERLGSPDDVATQTMWRSVRAKVLARRDDHTEADRLMRAAFGHFGASDSISQIGDAHRDFAEVLLLAGRQDEARAALERALELYERKEHVTAAAYARERFGVDGASVNAQFTMFRG